MYSPKINENLVSAMYQIKLKVGKAITVQANEAIAEYVKRIQTALKNNEGQRAKG